MKIKITEQPRVVMQNPLGKHRYFAWPTVARLKNGRLALAASGWRLSHICPFGKVAISFSEDDGRTWSRPAVALDTPLDDRDAGLCPFGVSGLILTSFNNTLDFQRENAKNHPEESAYRLDYLNLVTPEEERAALGSMYCVSTDNGQTFGALRHAPVTSPHGPVELADGTLLWVGRVFNQIDSEVRPIRAYALFPDREPELLGEIPQAKEGAIPCEPHAIQLPDGRILCHIRVQRRDPKLFTTYQSVSADGGRTWTQPVPLLGETGGAPAHLMRHSSGALISVYGYREAPFGIRAMISEDNGASWETDIPLAEGYCNWDLGYPATVECADGGLLTVYYAHAQENEPAEIFQIRWSLT